MWIKSSAKRCQPPAPIAGDDGEIAAADECLVQYLVTGVEPKYGCALQFGRRRNYAQPIQTDLAYDCRTDLEIATAKHKALRADGAENQPGLRVALQKLEDIVEAMETGDLPLESLLVRYEEGVKLAKVCQGKLAAAEIRIQELERAADGALKLKPMTVDTASD